MKKFRNALQVLPTICFTGLIFSSFVLADTGTTTSDSSTETPPAYAIAPQNYISDFPNEQLSIQTLKVSMVYDDVVIPGNGGMDIVVTRRMGGSKVKFDRLSLSTNMVYASDDPVFNLPCLGDFQDLSVFENEQRFISTGYDSASQIPSTGFAFFSNGSYFKCENTVPTLHFPDGRIYTFTQVAQDSTDYYVNTKYYVDDVTDRYGNSITYGYEDENLPASYNAPKLLKTITRNDGQVVNFHYRQASEHSPSEVDEITYSGKKVTYSYDANGAYVFTDAAGRETKYTYGMYSGIGSQIKTVTTPEGLVAEYFYSPYTETIGLRSFNVEAGESGGQLTSKSISGPGVPIKWYIYQNIASTADGYRMLAVQSDYKDEWDLSTVYTIRYGHYKNNVGQIVNIKGYEGEFTSGDRRGEYSSHTLLYELTNTWHQINSGTIGCHQSTDLPIFGFLDCSKYEISNVELKINNDGIFDAFTAAISSHNIYGQPLTVTKSFGNRTKVTTQSYDHDISNWILNQPRLNRIGDSLTTLENVKETTYYAKDHANFPFLPYEEKSFGVWQRKYSDYFADGSIKKVEFNQKLTGGDTTQNRYQSFASYKRGIAQTVTYPKRYLAGAMSATQVVDNDGRVTQITDLNGNTVNKGYDAVGRLKYVDPVDEGVADTLYTWSYDGGVSSDQPKSVMSRCTLNADKSACGDTATLTVTTTYDAKLRPIEVVKTDEDSQKSIYQNFAYDYFNRKAFISFLSDSVGETSGTSYEYDAIRRLISESVTDGGTQTTSYLSGNRVKVTNFNGHETTTTYLAYGEPDYSQALSIVSDINETQTVITTQAINIVGDLTSITQSGPDADGTGTVSQTEYRAYDTYHHLCKIARADVGTTVFNNNVLGEVQWQAQGVSGGSSTDCISNVTVEDHADANKKVTMNYDNLGDTWNVNYTDSATPNLTYGLDNNGNLKTLTAGLVSHSYNYNSLNLLDDETLIVEGKRFAKTATAKSLDYVYDTLGNLTSLTYPDGDKVAFAPNAFGQATQAIRQASTGRPAQTYASEALYYPTGSINTFTYGNGLSHKTELNTRMVPKSIKDSVSGGVTALDYTYTYYYNLNVKSIGDTLNPAYSLTNLTYDGLDRLLTTTGDITGIGSSSISYDGLGNITSYSSKDRNFSYEYAPTATDTRTNLLRAVDYADLSTNYKTFEYDERGNVISNGFTTFGFNLANQMTKAKGTAYTYLYDGHNRRVKQTDSKGTSYSLYSQDGTLLYRETPTGGINYIYLGKKLIAKDGVIAEDSGKQHYRPFGESLEGAIDDVGYTNHKFDTDLGLSYMQARYYDPVIGRFYSNDPVGYTTKNPVMSFNRYLYVNNNPYKYTDPNGAFLDTILDVGFIAYDLYDMATNGVNETNSASLAANVAGALIPGATGLGLAARAGKKACCFVAGTQVLTEDGYKNIEDIELGEKLWAKNVETGEQDWKPITKIFNEPDRGVFEIKLKGVDDFEQRIEATDDHPFYVVGFGWKTTIELKVGDQIETDGNGSMKVVSVVDEKRQALTFNFTVADFHTYYVTKKNILVHNCGIKMKEPNKPDATRVDGDPTQAVAEAGYDKVKLECAKCKLETSIKNRKAEQKRKGADTGHAKKIKTEQKQLDKVNRRLKEAQ